MNKSWHDSDEKASATLIIVGAIIAIVLILILTSTLAIADILRREALADCNRDVQYNPTINCVLR